MLHQHSKTSKASSVHFFVSSFLRFFVSTFEWTIIAFCYKPVTQVSHSQIEKIMVLR